MRSKTISNDIIEVNSKTASYVKHTKRVLHVRYKTYDKHKDNLSRGHGEGRES